MESQLFTFTGWDQNDTMAFQFYDCVLTVPIGEHKIGETIECIELDYAQAKFNIFDDAGNVLESHDLVLSVK